MEKSNQKDNEICCGRDAEFERNHTSHWLIAGIIAENVFILESEDCRGNHSRIIVSVFTVTVYMDIKGDALSSEKEEEGWRSTW